MVNRNRRNRSYWTLKRLAKLFATNRQYIVDAKKIRKINPWLIELIKRGEITIPKAKRILGIGPVQVTASLNPKAPGDKKILEFFAKTPKEKKSDAVKAILEREISGTAIH